MLSQLDPDRLLTPGQAAERLNVAPQTLRRWANAGQIEFRRTPGGARRYPESEIRRIEAGEEIPDD